MVVARRKREDLIAELRRDAGVIDGFLLRVIDELIEDYLGIKRLVVVILKNACLVPVIVLAVHRGKYLVCPLFGHSIKVDQLVILIILFLLIFRQITEHGAVEHMMPIDDIVIAARYAFTVYEQHAALRVITVEIHMQVFLGIIRRIHDRIVYIRIVYINPAVIIMIHIIELLILRYAVIGIRGYINNGRELIERLILFMISHDSLYRHKSRKQQKSYEKDSQSDSHRSCLFLLLLLFCGLRSLGIT